MKIKKRYIINILILLITAIGISGCALSPGDPQNHKSSSYITKSSFLLNTIITRLMRNIDNRVFKINTLLTSC